MSGETAISTTVNIARSLVCDAIEFMANYDYNPILSSDFFRYTRMLLLGGSFLLLAFHPFVKAVARPPLLRNFGMKFDDVRISILQLSLTLKGIELLPSESLFLRSLFVSIFPSANVQRSMKNSVDYPESKVTVDYLAIKVRIGTVAGLQDCDELDKKESSSDKHPFQAFADSGGESEGCKETTYWKQMIYRLILRPIIVVKLDRLTVNLEKTYLAPDPPEQFSASRGSSFQQVPSAVLPPDDDLSNYRQLPTFAQEIFVDNLLNEDVMEASRVTQYIEKWINHAQTKLRKKGVKSSEYEQRLPLKVERDLVSGDRNEDYDEGLTQTGGDKLNNTNTTVRKRQAEVKEEVDAKAPARTYDESERLNDLIYSVGRLLCHSLSIHAFNVSVVISGAGSTLVKDMRMKYNPRETNIIFARLPRNSRSQTILAADTLSFMFSPDSQCNLIISCAGLNLKVGEPLNSNINLNLKPSDSKNKRSPKIEDVFSDESNQRLLKTSPTKETQYTWHLIAHPFHVVAEVIGFLDFLVWTLNYDREWEKKNIGVNISATQVAVVLSPQHIHTVLLHLDDFSDAQSPFNEWMTWLASSLQEAKCITDDETSIYCANYARINGGNVSSRCGRDLTASEIIEMEKRMSSNDIISLRCKAMRKVWRIPKENEEFLSFLLCSRSTVLDRDNDSNASSLEASSPFNRFYSSPLDALASLVRHKSALLAPPLSVKLQAKTLLIDFPVTNGNTSKESIEPMPPIPTLMAAYGVSFTLTLTDPLFSGKPGYENEPRHVLNMSLNIEETEWDVAGTMTDFPSLPALRDGQLVGIIYKHRNRGTRGPILSIGFNMSVAPTEVMTPHLSVDCKTSDLVLIVNPFPLLSSIATLLDLFDLPFRTLDQPSSSLPIYAMTNFTDDNAVSVTEDPVDTKINLNTQTIVTIDNMTIILMLDRSKVRRGILELKLNTIQMKTETIGISGDLVILHDSMALRAGQIRSYQPNLKYGSLEWNVLPFKPLMTVDGARLRASLREMHNEGKESGVIRYGVDMKVGTEKFTLNGSPSNVVALLSTLESLDPLWGGSKEFRKAKEEERIKIEQQKQLMEEKTKLQYQRDALLRIFNSVDVDGSGSLQEEELQKVVRMLFEEGTFGTNESHVLDSGQQPTAEEIARERNRLISFIDPNRSNDVSFPEVDAFLFRVANDINDNNLIPKIEVTG
ncbi:hypothetical protein ACHAXS_011097, partial [Conticribra weissflogii]